MAGDVIQQLTIGEAHRTTNIGPITLLVAAALGPSPRKTRSRYAPATSQLQGSIHRLTRREDQRAHVVDGEAPRAQILLPAARDKTVRFCIGTVVAGE